MNSDQGLEGSPSWKETGTSLVGAPPCPPLAPPQFPSQQSQQPLVLLHLLQRSGLRSPALTPTSGHFSSLQPTRRRPRKKRQMRNEAFITGRALGLPSLQKLNVNCKNRLFKA